MAQKIEHKIGSSTLTWLPIDDVHLSHEDIYESWCNSNFLFREENVANGIEGLRPPQIGGVFAALGFERSDDSSAATLVMPTGTGKTMAVLYPAVKAIGEGLGDKIFYLTAKTITRTVAEQAFSILEEKGLAFRSITLTAKEKIAANQKKKRRK